MQTVKYEVNDGVATISLNRPQSLNAMNRVLIDETGDAFARANADDDVRVIGRRKILDLKTGK